MFVKSLKLSQLLVSICATGCMVAPLSKPKAAETPRHLERHGAFDVSAYGEENNTTAYYFSSTPIKTEPEGLKRSNPHMVVTRRGSKVEPHFYFGFPLKEDVPVTLEVDGKTITLAGHGEGAWGENPEKDLEVVRLLGRGETAHVTAPSRSGKKVTDTYSLSGATAAIKAINQGCAADKTCSGTSASEPIVPAPPQKGSPPKAPAQPSMPAKSELKTDVAPEKASTPQKEEKGKSVKKTGKSDKKSDTTQKSAQTVKQTEKAPVKKANAKASAKASGKSVPKPKKEKSRPPVDGE